MVLGHTNSGWFRCMDLGRFPALHALVRDGVCGGLTQRRAHVVSNACPHELGDVACEVQLQPRTVVCVESSMRNEQRRRPPVHLKALAGTGKPVHRLRC